MKLSNLKTIGKYAALFAAIVILYVVSRLLNGYNHQVFIQCIMGIMLTALVIIYFIRKKTGKSSGSEIVKAVIFAGLIMRIGYMLYTPCNVRDHDLWGFDKDAGGHAGYILTLIEEGRLPDTNILQYYQQPLFYILGSIVSIGVNGILGCSEPFMMVDAAKIISCFASCATLFLMESLCELCSLKEKGKIAALCIVAFLPAFYLTGGRVNPDALASLFMVLSLMYTFYWYRTPSWKNTLCLALIYGLGVMTKISCGVLAIFTLCIFLYKLYEEIKNKKAVNLIPKYAVFGLISLPIGLWYSIRNYLLFGQPLGYVMELSVNSDIYTGKNSIVQRLFSIDLPNLFSSVYADSWSDYNAPVYYLKSAMFGEFKYVVPVLIPVMLVFAAFALSCFTAVAAVRPLSRKNTDRKQIAMSVVFIIYYLSSLWFYSRYPFGCSMDFRYMTFMAIPAGILLGKFFEQRMSVKIKPVFYAFLWSFAFFSCVMYLSI